MAETPKLERFGRDVVWNLGSVCVLGVCGLLINVSIGRYYGPETYGVFAQVLAVYFILSQLSAGGFAFSTLSICGRHADEPNEIARIIASVLLLTAGLSSVVGLAGYFLSGAIGRVLDSPDVSVGVLWILPGLWCMTLNKVMLYSLNGLRHMRMYATLNAFRYVLILAIILVLTYSDAPASMLPLALSAGEIVLLPLIFGYVFWRYRPGPGRSLVHWTRVHLRFGGKAYLSGLLTDFNQKVDVIMVGYFLPDRVVGIYGFAAMLAMEGSYQFIVAIQNNVNPILSRLKNEGRMTEIRALVRKNIVLLCPAMAAIGIVGSLLYPYLATLLTQNEVFAEGWKYFAVLMAGIVIASTYLPFHVLLNQWGHPGWFVVFLALQVATNVAFNAFLIPLWGAMGAAAATAIAFVLSIVFLKVITKHVTGISL